MGLRYVKQQNKRYYYEQPRIVEMRHKYLLRLKQNREDDKTVIYLDETWMHSHDGLDRSWLEKDSITGNNITYSTTIM